MVQPAKDAITEFCHLHNIPSRNELARRLNIARQTIFRWDKCEELPNYVRKDYFDVYVASIPIKALTSSLNELHPSFRKECIIALQKLVERLKWAITTQHTLDQFKAVLDEISIVENQFHDLDPRRVRLSTADLQPKGILCTAPEWTDSDEEF